MTLLRKSPNTPSDKIIWIFLGDKLGDNAQIELVGKALEKALSADIKYKKLTYNEKHRRSNIRLQASLESMDKNTSDALNFEPAPDAIIFTGRRAVPIARWVQQQCLQVFEKKVQLISIGKPRAPYFWFDLIVSTPQYLLPKWLPNLLLNDFTLNRIEENQQIQYEKHNVFRSSKKSCVVFMGGERSGFRIRSSEIDSIVNTMLLFKHNNPEHQILIIGSKSTPIKTMALLSKELSNKAMFFSWDTPDKPSYQELLAYGDMFFVTEDSASVLTEALSTSKKVYLLKLHQRKKENYLSIFFWIQRALIYTLYPLGLHDPNRVVRRFSNNLLDKGYIEVYGEKNSSTKNTETSYALNNELQRTVNQIASLIESNN